MVMQYYTMVANYILNAKSFKMKSYARAMSRATQPIDLVLCEKLKFTAYV